MASSCAKGSLDWTLGRIYSWEGQLGIGTLWTIMDYHGLLTEMTKSLSLDIFKGCVDMALRDMV